MLMMVQSIPKVLDHPSSFLQTSTEKEQVVLVTTETVATVVALVLVRQTEDHLSESVMKPVQTEEMSSIQMETSFLTEEMVAVESSSTLMLSTLMDL